MISKELLSEVLKKEIREFVIEKNELRYILKDDINDIPELYFINIYELSHKCKEWAKSKEFIIHSSPTQKIEYTAIAQHFDLNKFYYGQNQSYALSEYEAIFKLCQWILDKED